MHPTGIRYKSRKSRLAWCELAGIRWVYNKCVVNIYIYKLCCCKIRNHLVYVQCTCIIQIYNTLRFEISQAIVFLVDSGIEKTKSDHPNDGNAFPSTLFGRWNSFSHVSTLLQGLSRIRTFTTGSNIFSFLCDISITLSNMLCAYSLYFI